MDISTGMLTGKAIIDAQKEGYLYISDFDEDNVNPNSYNLSIGNELSYMNVPRQYIKPCRPGIIDGGHIRQDIVFTNTSCGANVYDVQEAFEWNGYDTCLPNIVDPRVEQNYITERITENGFVLSPNRVYLIPTKETISTDYFIPMITGRSSMGRLGISVHQEAGFGDIGYTGVWTLQVKTTYPTRIYPGMKMCQIYFMTPYGDTEMKYHGKYQCSVGVTGSKSHLDFQGK